MKKSKGFSLVELLVVITIIAILSVVAYTAIGGQTIKARDSKRKQDMSTIQSAMELYFVEYSRYPGSLENGEATAGDGWKIPRKYLSEIPADPQGDPYIYAVSSGTYELATVLENDGDVANIRAYVVGNSDTPLIQAGGGQEAPNAVYWDGAAFASCVAGTDIEDDGTCLPYNPTD